MQIVVIFRSLCCDALFKCIAFGSTPVPDYRNDVKLLLNNQSKAL